MFDQINKQLYEILQLVKNPGRYVGGEFGSVKKCHDGNLLFALCFPDLYEIGMSNNAIKIIYEALNKVNKVVCERVFAVESDFLNYLKEKNLPLFTLESKCPVKEYDILGISIGYELSATSILKILEYANIPLRSLDRKNDDPIVIGGGPAITNPVPFGPFFEAVFIGEADKVLPELVKNLANEKEKGAKRTDLLDIVKQSDGFWYSGKKEKTKKIFFEGFHSQMFNQKYTVPVPSIRTVQDHGVVEIMRGCPNGCRFCHAGYFYRQQREKPIELIMREIESVFANGYREITLSSLSTGDYSLLLPLMETIHAVYDDNNVSISLPSLKVDSFTLPVLKAVAKTRKSGLTFAIESPSEYAQKVINKTVSITQVIDILHAAKDEGWRLAKFYFMIGLPGIGNGKETDEAEEIISFIDTVYNSVKINLNINIGTFIPKPHTPFQWDAQLGYDDAGHLLHGIKQYFKNNKNIKVSYHDPFISMIESIISRGDERVAEIIEDAYSSGAYLDAWEEYLRRDIWEIVLHEHKEMINEILAEKPLDAELPWDTIDIGVSKKYLIQERKRAESGILTSGCTEDCDHLCGICNKEKAIIVSKEKNDHEEPYLHTKESKNTIPSELFYYYLIRYKKIDEAIFLGHIDTMNVFERALQRARIPMATSNGYNPKPKLTFAHPLMLGVASESEYAMIETVEKIEASKIKERLQVMLPHGLYIDTITFAGELFAGAPKKKSLMAAYGGSLFQIECQDAIYFNNMYNIINSCICDGGYIDKIQNTVAELFLPDTGRKNGNLRYYIEKIEPVPSFLAKCYITRKDTYASGKKKYEDVY